MMKMTLIATAALLFAGAAIAAPTEATVKQPVAKATAPVEMTAKQLDTVVGAAAPANPGGFGLDRAAFIAAAPKGGVNVVGTAAYYLQARAGDNGDINHEYMIANGDLPEGVTPGQ